MKKLIPAVMWLILGPSVTTALAWLVFWLLTYVLGGGIKLDRARTSGEQLITSLALPLAGLALTVGIFFSVAMAIRQVIKPSSDCKR